MMTVQFLEQIKENMELVVQFGYVILFGQIFPLAAFFSMLSNHLQIKIQAHNTRITRRGKPEIAISIGTWIDCLEFLGKINVVTNTVMLFFTFRNFRKIFIDTGEEFSEFEVNSLGWESLYFLMFLMAVEHFVFFLRLVIRNYSEVNPPFVKQGQIERAKLIKQFQDKFATRSKSMHQVDPGLIEFTPMPLIS